MAAPKNALCVSNDGVAGDGLNQYSLLRQVTLWHQRFDAAALIAEHDFQMQDLFAIALKPKVAGFNQPACAGPTATS